MYTWNLHTRILDKSVVGFKHTVWGAKCIKLWPWNQERNSRIIQMGAFSTVLLAWSTFIQVGSTCWFEQNSINGKLTANQSAIFSELMLYVTGMELPKDLIQRRQWFGSSNELLKTLRPDYKCNAENGVQSNGLLQEAHFLASCNYETGTKWGKQASHLQTMKFIRISVR